jgi:aminoglycoside phosphotransferase (APT) family kinase protein
VAGGREPVVLKIYSERFEWMLRKELFVYERLREASVPAPSVVAADESQRMLALTKLDGVMVGSLGELEESVLCDINRQIGRMLAALHEVELDEFGYVGVGGVVDGHATNLDYMRFQFAKKLREFVELGGDADLATSVERYAASREELLEGCERPSFCHNDCHYANVLVLPAEGGWRISGLIDFENTVAGDPLLDLAKTHCYARHRSETTLAALVEGHGGARVGWRETVDVYVVYHLVELWTWFASIARPDPLGGIAGRLRDLTR